MMSICQGVPPGRCQMPCHSRQRSPAAVHEMQIVQTGGTGHGRHDTEAKVTVQSRRVDMEVYIPVPDQQARPERAHGMDHGTCPAPMSFYVQFCHDVPGFCLCGAGHRLPGGYVVHTVSLWGAVCLQEKKAFLFDMLGTFFYGKKRQNFPLQSWKKGSCRSVADRGVPSWPGHDVISRRDLWIFVTRRQPARIVAAVAA